MLQFVFSLFGTFVSSDLFDYFFIPVLILAFIASIPGMFRSIFRLR